MPSQQIPLALAPFVGRVQELGALAELLDRPEIRLLTLTGAGGSGKTRLAFELVRQIAPASADGVILVDLAPLADPAFVGLAIAQALDLPNDTQVDALIEALTDRAPLLLLDNFEHVLDAAPLVVRLLAQCPKLRMLLTSRAVLGVSGEHVFVVPPLPVDDAMQLFVERARAANAALPATATPVQTVQQICMRLDGLPLAIELAAARVRVLPPQALLARLEAPLSLLTGGGRERPARHQAMRNTIQWSVSLLSPAEQYTFQRMAVFRGGWTIEAAATLIGEEPIDILDLMTSLVDKSLVECSHRLPASEPRFRMLETLREFGLEQLAAHGQSETVEHQHALYPLSIAEPRSFSPAHGQEPRGPKRHQWLGHLEVELDNFRSALAWALRSTARTSLGLSLALGLLPLWEERGYWTEAERGWSDSSGR